LKIDQTIGSALQNQLSSSAIHKQFNSTNRSIQDNSINYESNTSYDKSKNHYLKNSFAKTLGITKDNFVIESETERQDRLKTLHNLLDQNLKYTSKGIIKNETFVSA